MCGDKVGGQAVEFGGGGGDGLAAIGDALVETGFEVGDAVGQGLRLCALLGWQGDAGAFESGERAREQQFGGGIGAGLRNGLDAFEDGARERELVGFCRDPHFAIGAGLAAGFVGAGFAVEGEFAAAAGDDFGDVIETAHGLREAGGAGFARQLRDARADFGDEGIAAPVDDAGIGGIADDVAEKFGGRGRGGGGCRGGSGQRGGREQGGKQGSGHRDGPVEKLSMDEVRMWAARAQSAAMSFVEAGWRFVPGKPSVRFVFARECGQRMAHAPHAKNRP